MAIEIVDLPMKNGGFSIVFCRFTSGYTLWLFHIAMENHHFQ